MLPLEPSVDLELSLWFKVFPDLLNDFFCALIKITSTQKADSFEVESVALFLKVEFSRLNWFIVAT